MATGTASPVANDPRTAAPRRRWRWSWLFWAVPLFLVLFVVVSDLFGWAYLRKPVEKILASQLQREVRIDPPFSLHLRRSIPVRVGGVWIGAPDWSSQPHFAAVENIEADVDWGILVGRQPRLHRLSVKKADIRAERDAEGRASWAMGAPDKEPPAEPSQPMLPVIESLSIGEAGIDVKDAANQVDMKIQASTQDGGAAGGDARTGGLVAKAEGSWRKEPIKVEVRTPGLQPLLEGGELKGLQVDARLRSTKISFDGSLSALAASGDVTGTVNASGSSLAELAIIPGLTLPATPAYKLEGDLQRTGSTVKVDVRRAEVGSSSMMAKLEYDGSGATPLLRGSLNASRLVLQDLGPSIGAEGEGSKGGKSKPKADDGGNGKKAQARDGKAGQNRNAAQRDADAKRAKEARSTKEAKDASKSDGKEAKATKGKAGSTAASQRVLPDREFNLPSLRAMNADVAVDLQKLDLGTDALRPLRSLKTRLMLQDGVLKLEDLKSNVAGGVVSGVISLDGSAADATPVFDSKLKWDRVDLENWVSVSDDLLVTGRFSGETNLKGRGKSTADILQSLAGTVRGHIQGGSISHQIVELAGLDAGQAIGVFFRGDEPLELSCALVDLTAEKGRLRSNLFVLNTSDTIFFVQGGLNFRSEELDLRLVQAPKDWSPLSLRTPITVRGTLGDPAIGVEAVPLAMKVLSSVVLAAVTPIAALLPLIDVDESKARAGCEPAIDFVRKKSAELAEKSAPADEGKKPEAPRDEKGNLRRPGRAPGDHP